MAEEEIRQNLLVSAAEDEVVREVRTNYEAAYLAKDDIGVQSDLATLDDYWAGRARKPMGEDDPVSNVNIILPVIEGQIADLVDEPMDIHVEGVGPSDIEFSEDAQIMLRDVWRRNKMIPKIDRFERNRLKFGTGIWHTAYDPKLDMPILQTVSPNNFFPDPKITAADLLDEGDFIIVARPMSLKLLRRKYGEKAMYVRPNLNPSYDPQMFTGEKAEDVHYVLNRKALVLTQYARDEKGDLYVVTMADNVLLRDSRKERKGPFYKHNRYPFSVVTCYPREGILWGMGDVEILRPIQDAINDLDDQIRMNARLMGNLQVVVGITSGINPFKWTNKPGLKIPARDPNAWKIVQPPSIPAYIPNRRTELMQEAERVSGRADVTEGRRPTGIEAAAAIAALQQAGMRRVRHKRLMLEAGFNECMEQWLGMIAEEWTEERAFRVTEKPPNYKWLRGSKLNEVPILGPDGPVLDELGELMKKEAQLDAHVTIGTGLMMNSYMAYQTALTLATAGLMSQPEARRVIAKALNWPLLDLPEGPMAPMKGVTPTAGGAGPDAIAAMQSVQSELPPQVMDAVMQAGLGMGV